MTKENDRRQFLKSMATGGTVALTAWPVLADQTPESLPAPGYKVFSVSQAALMGAIAEQLIPTDDYPGGKQAGVVEFVDRVLAGPFGKFYRSRYEEGFRAIDRLSQERFKHNFVSLDSEAQTAILQALESGKSVDATAHEFFGLVLRHTYEGYYGDPKHGGNRNEVSWKMIGFEG